jgi:hypothetical protein
VQVRQQNVLDRKTVLGGEREVLIDVALRVHDGGDSGLLVGDQIRRVGEAAEVELLEDHLYKFSHELQVESLALWL